MIAVSQCCGLKAERAVAVAQVEVEVVEVDVVGDVR